MFNKVKDIIYFLIFVLFFTFIIFYYFSDENKKKIYKNRGNITKNVENHSSYIPLLKNDTNGIIEYNLSNIENKKIKKRHFWELLKKDEN